MMLIERDAELEALDECLKAARGGEGRLVFLRGEAGAGKTALVREFSDSVRGAKVLVGACDPLATPRPLGPVLDMADKLAVIGGTPVGADASRELLFERFHAELNARAWTSVIVIEDAHWADEATLDLLRFIGRRLSDANGMVVVTARADGLRSDHPLRIMMGDLATAPGARRIELGPLSRDGVERLAGNMGVADADIDAVLAATQGNAFLVTEALAAGDRDGVPMSIRDSVAARVSRLPAPVRTVVEAAAVVPTRVDTWLLTALAGVASTHVDAAVTLGMLRDDAPGTVAFRHELARLAVEEELLPARRSALHASAVELLLARSGDEVDAARVAHHAELAGDHQTARVYAERAARRAVELGARREASDQYARALRHTEGIGTAELADLWEGYARAVGQIDRPLEMLEATEKLVALRRELGDAVRLGDSLFGSSLANWHAGRAAEGLARAKEAVEVLKTIEPGPLLADAYANVASFSMLARRLDDVELWAQPGIDLAEQLNAGRPLSRGLNAIGTARILRGDLSGVALVEQSMDAAAGVGLDDHVVLGWLNIGSAAAEAKLYEAAVPALERARELGDELQLDAYVYDATAWLARSALDTGDWAAAERYIGNVPIGLGHGDPSYRMVAMEVLGQLHARRGDRDPWPYLDEAWELAETSKDPSRRLPLAAVRAEAAWLAGEPERIVELVSDTYEQACELELPWSIGALGALLRRAGKLDELPGGAAEPHLLHAAGHLSEAAKAWDAIGCPYESAEALADSQDAAALREALERSDRLGAAPLAARVRRQLRQLGVRDVPKGPQKTTAANPAGLTRRQAEVLELLDLGISDADIAERLFISAKTAGHHVSAILRKLEVSSRTEAVRVARDQGLLDP